MHRIISFFFILIISGQIDAMDRRGRLGIGLNNQLRNDLPAVSFKLQKSKSFALGGLVAVNNNSVGGGFGAGLKIYRNFFSEPLLNFYGSLLTAIIKKEYPGDSQSGFQVDATMGSEFSFPNLESIGFSFEFGLSLNKLDDFIVQTVGDHIVSAGIHFYL